jgi:hypothetical protein
LRFFTAAYASHGAWETACGRVGFFLAPQAFQAEEKWESGFWIATFPEPAVLPGFVFFWFK